MIQLTDEQLDKADQLAQMYYDNGSVEEELATYIKIAWQHDQDLMNGDMEYFNE